MAHDKAIVLEVLPHLEASLKWSPNRQKRQSRRQRFLWVWSSINTAFTEDPAFLNEVARAFPSVAQMERKSRFYRLADDGYDNLTRNRKIERQRLAPKRRNCRTRGFQ